MASMLEMYQIAKDMQNTQIANRPEHPDTSWAKAIMTGLQGFEQGKKDYETAKDKKIERAKKLLEMSNMMNSLGILQQYGAMDEPTSQVLQQAREMLDFENRKKAFDETGAGDIQTNTFQKKIKEMFESDDRTVELDVSPTGTSLKSKPVNEVDAMLKKARTEAAKAQAAKANADADAKARGGKGSGGKLTELTDAQLLTLRDKYQKTLNDPVYALMEDIDKEKIKTYLGALDEEFNRRNIGKGKKFPKPVTDLPETPDEPMGFWEGLFSDKAKPATPAKPEAPKAAKDKYGFTVGEEQKGYKYMGNNQWKKIKK